MPCTLYLSFMFRRCFVILSLALFACALVAQAATPPPAASGKGTKTQKSKPEKAVATEFSEDVAKQALNRIRDGLQGHNPRQMLSAFSRDQMDGYYAFEDRLYSYFDRYDSFRAYFHILQTSMENGRGVALAEWQIEGTPRSGPTERHEGQVRFEFASGAKGWQIVEFSPRDFFR
ncbi:MAG: hypothetical protein ACM3JB_27730 [Acidobacteriaceae bacterium]